MPKRAGLDSLYQMRQSGATLRQIAGHFGISQGWGGQLLRKHYGSTDIQGFLTVAELARLAGCGQDYVIRLKRRGIIQPARIWRKNRLWKPETIATIIIYRDSHPERCPVCSAPLPSNRFIYCSTVCRIEANKYRNLSDKAKKRHNEQVAKWKREHPEQSRQIMQRACRKYMAKKSLTPLNNGRSADTCFLCNAAVGYPL